MQTEDNNTSSPSPAQEPVAFMTKTGFDNWMKGKDPEQHVLLRSGNGSEELPRVALYAHPSPAQEPETMFGITGATSAQEALAVALFSYRCPGVLMQDEDFPHYEAAAKLALSYHDDPSEAPAAQEPVRLSRDRIDEIADSEECNPDNRGWGAKFSYVKFARAIEREVRTHPSPSPSLTKAREALDTADKQIKRLRGTLEYIAAQAKNNYPTVLSVIRANAEAALNDEWQATVDAGLAAKDARIAELEKALYRIACYDDERANAHLKHTGSYGAFDEPGSVQIARSVVKEKKEDDQ